MLAEFMSGLLFTDQFGSLHCSFLVQYPSPTIDIDVNDELGPVYAFWQLL